MPAAAAATVIAVAAGLGGWGLRGAAPGSPPAGSMAQPTLHTAALMTASHHTIGKVFLYSGSPGWLYMMVDTGSGNGTVVCQLEGRDRGNTTIGSFRLTGGYGHWGGPEPLQAATVASARLTAADGKVLAAASFSPVRLPAARDAPAHRVRPAPRRERYAHAKALPVPALVWRDTASGMAGGIAAWLRPGRM
jgi:hypothetical protein